MEILPGNTAGMDLPEFPAVGYDGQYIPLNYLAARVPNDAICKLVGKKSSSQVTLEEMLSIYDILESEKNLSGPDALEKYYLEYYNVENLFILSSTRINKITGSGANGIYTVDYKGRTFEDVYNEYLENYPYFKYANIEDNGTYMRVQLSEVEMNLAALQYNYFYSTSLGFAVGRTIDKSEAQQKQTPSPFAGFANRNESTYIDADAYIAEQLNYDTLIKGTGEGSVVMGGYINIQLTNNSYQSFTNKIYIGFQLVPEETETPPTPTPPNGGGSGGGGGGGSTPGGRRATPETNGPGITIEPEAVPLAPLPEITIPENEVPLAPLPKTGDSVISQWICLMSGLLLGMYGLFGRKKEDF